MFRGTGFPPNASGNGYTPSSASSIHDPPASRAPPTSRGCATSARRSSRPVALGVPPASPHAAATDAAIRASRRGVRPRSTPQRVYAAEVPPSTLGTFPVLLSGRRLDARAFDGRGLDVIAPA